MHLQLPRFVVSFFFYRTTALGSRGEASQQLYTKGSVIVLTEFDHGTAGTLQNTNV